MLNRIAEKLDAGDFLSREEGLFLFGEDVSLHRLGVFADRLRRRINGNVGWYNINTHLNPTNRCTLRCPLCAFHAVPGSSKAYTLTFDEMLRRASEAVLAGCTELHIVGGIHPENPYSWYRDIVSRIREIGPRLHIKAWAAPEIAHFAASSGMSVEEVLRDLREAGLNSLPGGGAEIFAPEPRRQIAPKKIDADTWLAIHGTAHRLGIPTNATMLFGHVESVADRVDHLLRLRDLQGESLQSGHGDDAGTGFDAFVPLVYQSHERLPLEPLPAASILRTVAISRLLLPNIPHIKAYWVTFGVALAQMSLGYGADDLDGTIRGERVHHEAGSPAPTSLGVEELRSLIAETGLEPVERDSRYHPVKQYRSSSG